MRKVSSALLLTALVVAPVVARAQTAAAAHPDYSGSYVLDPAQSEGQMLPQKMTLKITQTPAGLTLDRTQTNQMGESTAQLKYALDGTASKNTLTMGGNPVDVSTVVTWEGASPVLTSSMKFGENDAQSVEKWSLAPDGKKLSIERKISAGGQEFMNKLVLVKQ
jgi:ABC-type xylose transport system substrate-binding protein